MLHFFYSPEGKLVKVATECKDATPIDAEGNKNTARWDFTTLEIAEKIAADATELTGEKYIATDAGDWCSPRYDVIRAPKVGDEVSKAFNGDYYPEGTIVKISDSMRRIETSTGKVFFRRKKTGSWLYKGMWSMVGGHTNRWNPEF